MERYYTLNGEEVVVLTPHVCDFNAYFGRCKFPLGEGCECYADWNDSRDIDFPEDCPLKQKPTCSRQMELDFSGKWEQLMHVTYMFWVSNAERVRQWHNWKPNE